MAIKPLLSSRTEAETVNNYVCYDPEAVVISKARRIWGIMDGWSPKELRERSDAIYTLLLGEKRRRCSRELVTTVLCLEFGPREKGEPDD